MSVNQERVEAAVLVLKAAYEDGAVKLGEKSPADVCPDWAEITPVDRYAVTTLLYWLDNASDRPAMPSASSRAD